MIDLNQISSKQKKDQAIMVLIAEARRVCGNLERNVELAKVNVETMCIDFNYLMLTERGLEENIPQTYSDKYDNTCSRDCFHSVEIGEARRIAEKYPLSTEEIKQVIERLRTL